ncbi:hypothetical protein BVY04_03110 [bacterium M21]|nr:hypothetical protein BVY04_03110 [bacterium M21]
MRADNPLALERIYDVFGSQLYGYQISLLCCKADAEDCFQNLFIRIAEKRRLLIGKEQLKAYLMTMARNEALEFIRRRKKTTPTLVDQEAVLTTDETDHFLPVEELSSALAALPLEQREVISLKIYQELTFAEIGQRLGISPNTAASRYRYGLKKMKELMQEVIS